MKIFILLSGKRSGIAKIRTETIAEIMVFLLSRNIDNGINVLNGYVEIRDVVTVSSAKANDEQIQLSENSILIILTIPVVLMCIAGFTSYNVLSLIQQEFK